MTAIPVLDSSGNVLEVISVLRDITESLELQDQLKNSMEKTELYRQELSYYRALEIGAGAFISQSPSMEGVKTMINQVAPVDATIMITGETGVGKEVIAREIHERSRRRNGPYIKVNCAAIPPSLIESELFGYEKGAFTGASGRRKLGFFEMANGGTILLDEIGELPMDLQAKLLRVLQEHEFNRVGGTVPVSCDARVLATTGRFNRSYNTSKEFDEAALAVLARYSWPGNVRELANVVERLDEVRRLVAEHERGYHRGDVGAELLGRVHEDWTLDHPLPALGRDEEVDEGLRPGRWKARG